MSRAATGDVVVEKPRNNVYTVLVAVALIAELVAFIVLIQQAGNIFPGKGLFS